MTFRDTNASGLGKYRANAFKRIFFIKMNVKEDIEMFINFEKIYIFALENYRIATHPRKVFQFI